MKYKIKAKKTFIFISEMHPTLSKGSENRVKYKIKVKKIYFLFPSCHPTQISAAVMMSVADIQSSVEQKSLGQERKGRLDFFRIRYGRRKHPSDCKR